MHPKNENDVTIVYLFYKHRQPKRWLCAIIRKLNGDGFLITTYPTDAIKEGECVWQKVSVYYDPIGNTLEETGDEVILMKNKEGAVIGFEKLNYTLAANANLKISLETAIAQ